MTAVSSDTLETPQRERRATLRVLVVDDLPEIRFLLEIAVSREPRITLVGQAEDGRQAIEKVELLRPEVVVMDLQMPNMNGLDATRHITEQWPQVEVIGFTSSGVEDGHQGMSDAGAVASFDKHQLKELMDFLRTRAGRR